MLKWQEENGHYLGFVDGDLLYRVFYGDGWEWEDLTALEGYFEYDTPEEAMQAATAAWAQRVEQEDKLMLIDLEISLEEIEEILGDMLYEERKENELFN